jgi:antitoxin component of MazEF toxin-antitoxin module
VEKVETNNIKIAEWNKKKLDRTGTSKCVIIPKRYVEELGLENGINVVVTKNEVIITKTAV